MPNELIFYLLAAFTAIAAICSMSFRNLVHCSLSLIATFVGLAAIYLQLNAQFVGFAQVLVYAGAVGILVVFAILLTRGSEVLGPLTNQKISAFWSLSIAALLLGSLLFPILTTHSLKREAMPVPSATVKDIGVQLMTTYVLPLQAAGLLLTAALLGGVVIALREDDKQGLPTRLPKKDQELTKSEEVGSC